MPTERIVSNPIMERKDNISKMRDIKLSKAAIQYEFCEWTRLYSFLIPLLSFLIAPIVMSWNVMYGIPIIIVDAISIIIWLLTPEYESVEECQKAISERAYRKCERKNRKWLM